MRMVHAYQASVYVGEGSEEREEETGTGRRGYGESGTEKTTDGDRGDGRRGRREVGEAVAQGDDGKDNGIGDDDGTADGDI